jgi:hypothetical protein
MSNELLVLRIEALERRARRARRVGTTCALALASALVLGWASGSAPLQEAAQGAAKPQPAELILRKLTIVDDEGRPRIVLAQDPADTQRRSRGAGITVYDDRGDERGGFGTMDDGSVVFARDAPEGVGASMRDRAGIVVGPQGQSSFMLIDNQTRGVVKLQSDGDGKGGLQLFKWDMEAKNVQVATLMFDGTETETHEFDG